MGPRPSPNDAAFRFQFSDGECLYRDHHGRRVIADAEGGGSFFVEKADIPILTYADEVGTDLFRGTYRQSLTVCTQEQGDVIVAVRRGDPPEQDQDRIVTTGRFEGAGWLMSASAPAQLDDRRERAPEGLAAPFFVSAFCQGEMEILPAPDVACRLVDGFSIADTAALKGRDFRVQNISDATPLASSFGNGENRDAFVASHLNAASWTCPLPAGCQGLRLRKVYDRFHGRQRARVLVDGEFAGWWYEPLEDRTARWAVADFGIEPRFLEGKSQARIAIDPPPGTPLWSVSEIQVFAM